MKNLDTSIWITQQAFANERGVSVQNVNNWIRRGNIKTKKLPGSKITLVNKNSLKIDNEHPKRRDKK